MIPFVLAQTEPIGIPGPELMPPLGQTLGALLVVVALLVGLTWLLRRSPLGRRGSKGFGVESTLPLGERRSLAVVTVEGRRLLVGLAPNNVSLVTELSPPDSFEQAVASAQRSERAS